MLYQFQWGYGKTAARSPKYKEWARRNATVMARMCDIAIREEILLPQAAYGYWRCAAPGNEVILFDDSAPGKRARGRAFLVPAPEQGRWPLHRRFFRDVDDPGLDGNRRDVIGCRS